MTLFATMLLVFGLSVKAQMGKYSSQIGFSKQNFVDSIEIEYEYGQVYVPVMIHGERHRFLLDTGAGQAVVYDDAPIEGCRTLGQIGSRDAVGRRDTVSLVLLPALELGTLTLTGCQATVQHRSIRNRRIDGILGFDLVCSGIQMKIDTDKKKLIISDRRDFFRPEGGFDIKYKIDYHVPYIRITPFGKYREWVLFDTGSRQLYSMNKESFDKGAWQCPPQQIVGRTMGHHAIGFSGVESRGQVVALRLEDLRLGAFSLQKVHAITTQGGSHLGGALLKYGAVVFNPQRKLMTFQPYNNEMSVLVNNIPTDMMVVPVNDKAVIGLVWEGSKAYQEGFRQGDTIIMIDETPIRSFADYANFRHLIGFTYTYTLMDRMGNTRKVRSKKATF